MKDGKPELVKNGLKLTKNFNNHGNKTLMNMNMNIITLHTNMKLTKISKSIATLTSIVWWLRANWWLAHLIMRAAVWLAGRWNHGWLRCNWSTYNETSLKGRNTDENWAWSHELCSDSKDFKMQCKDEYFAFQKYVYTIFTLLALRIKVRPACLSAKIVRGVRGHRQKTRKKQCEIG